MFAASYFAKGYFPAVFFGQVVDEVLPTIMPGVGPDAQRKPETANSTDRIRLDDEEILQIVALLGTAL